MKGVILYSRGTKQNMMSVPVFNSAQGQGQGDRNVKALSGLYSQPFLFEIGCITSPSEQPDFLILGWPDFSGRLVFVFSYRGFLTLVFLIMTGRWKLFWGRRLPRL